MPDQNDQQAEALIAALAPKLIEAILPKITESVEPCCDPRRSSG